MKKIIATVAALGAVGTLTAAGQVPQWDRRALDGGAVEFRLQNDEGAAIILACHRQGVSAGFEFPSPLEDTERATIRGIPGELQNVAVSRVSDRVVSVTSVQGLDAMLRLLRNTARLQVRVAGERASFNIFGSNTVVSECLEGQEDAIGLPSRRFEE